MMNGLDIDGTLPGQKIEKEELNDVIRRESEEVASNTSKSLGNSNGDDDGHGTGGDQ